jgi:ribosomal protein L32E
MFSNDFTPKNPNIFACENCNFNTCNKKDFNRHIQTKKHKINDYQCLSMGNTQKTLHECSCGKTYKDNSGLWRHKKKCKADIPAEVEESDIYNDDDLTKDTEALIKYLMKENSEFKQMLMDQNKQMIELAKTAGHNTSHNNSHNKSFNLQFFLNETCKDAMNITEFVDSIKLQLSDLINIGEVGYVEGISNIITSNLKALDVTQRPVHCADKKREVLYVKDEDKWEKEDDEKKKIRRAITKIANKNYVLIPQFREKYPECVKSSSPLSTQYNKIIIEAMGGSGDNDLEKQNKIIRNITKVTTIEKGEME